MNVERLKPWHTLSGRQEVYYDHQGIRELGEGLPTNKPPLDMVAVGDINMDKAGPKSKVFRFITPQWSSILHDKEGKQRTFGPYTMNVERLKPWHTLSGRQEIYYDHQEIGRAHV